MTRKPAPETPETHETAAPPADDTPDLWTPSDKLVQGARLLAEAAIESYANGEVGDAADTLAAIRALVLGPQPSPLQRFLHDLAPAIEAVAPKVLDMMLAIQRDRTQPRTSAAWPVYPLRPEPPIAAPAPGDGASHVNG